MAKRMPPDQPSNEIALEKRSSAAPLLASSSRWRRQLFSTYASALRAWRGDVIAVA